MIQAPNLSETNESTAHVHHVLAAEQTVLSCHFRDECRITPAGWDDLGVTKAGKELHDSMIQLRMEESLEKAWRAMTHDHRAVGAAQADKWSRRKMYAGIEE